MTDLPNLHSLTLDLGEVKPGAPLRLLMTGYVNYFFEHCSGWRIHSAHDSLVKLMD